MSKCIGCGVELQNKNIDELGYVENLSKSICNRCFRLKNYGEYKNVPLNNKDYIKIINNISNDSLIIYVADILSLNLENINNYKKVLLVITKRDIIPKSVKEYKIINYIKERYPNIIDIIIVSSIKNYNIDYLYEKIKLLSNNKNIYVIGYTNTGKSTLINKLINNYSNNKTNITTSMYPSTTLDKISININNLTIIDTPGLIDEANIINYIEKKDLKKVLPKKTIKPKTCQIKGNGSIIIDNYVRIDYETNIQNSIVIYASEALNIKFNSLSNNKLKELKKHIFSIKDNKDLVVSGLCFIKTTKPIKIEIYTIDKVKPYLRDNLI